MKAAFLILSLLLCGCATSTLEKRKSEKWSSYQSLAPDQKTLVDQGQITVGMTEDAVYLAWGKPSEILQSEDQTGPATKWLYKDVYLQSYTYWAFRPTARSSAYYLSGRGVPEGTVMERRLEHSYEPHTYVKAEVDFVNGVVTKWRERSHAD